MPVMVLIFAQCILASAGSSSNGTFTVTKSQNNCYGDGISCWFRGRFNKASQCEVRRPMELTGFSEGELN
jgi:hypothetical protein